MDVRLAHLKDSQMCNCTSNGLKKLRACISYNAEAAFSGFKLFRNIFYLIHLPNK